MFAFQRLQQNLVGFHQVESHIQEPNAIKRCIALAAKRLSQEAPDESRELGKTIAGLVGCSVRVGGLMWLACLAGWWFQSVSWLISN